MAMMRAVPLPLLLLAALVLLMSLTVVIQQGAAAAVGDDNEFSAVSFFPGAGSQIHAQPLTIEVSFNQPPSMSFLSACDLKPRRVIQIYNVASATTSPSSLVYSPGSQEIQTFVVGSTGQSSHTISFMLPRGIASHLGASFSVVVRPECVKPSGKTVMQQQFYLGIFTIKTDWTDPYTNEPYDVRFTINNVGNMTNEWIADLRGKLVQAVQDSLGINRARIIDANITSYHPENSSIDIVLTLIEDKAAAASFSFSASSPSPSSPHSGDEDLQVARSPRSLAEDLASLINCETCISSLSLPFLDIDNPLSNSIEYCSSSSCYWNPDFRCQQKNSVTVNSYTMYILGFAVVAFTFLWLARCMNGNSAMYIFLLLFSFADFGSLAYMTYKIWNVHCLEELYLPRVALGCMITSLFFNLFSSVMTFKGAPVALKKWLDDNLVVAGCCVFLGMFDPGNLFLLRSQLCGISSLAAPFDPNVERYIESRSYIGVLAEDLAQVIINILVITRLQHWPLANVISVTISMFGCLRILITLILMYLVEPRYHVLDKYRLARRTSQTQTQAGLQLELPSMAGPVASSTAAAAAAAGNANAELLGDGASPDKKKPTRTRGLSDSEFNLGQIRRSSQHSPDAP